MAYYSLQTLMFRKVDVLNYTISFLMRKSVSILSFLTKLKNLLK